MLVMELQAFARQSERFVRTYEYDDRTVVVADLGGDGTVDVADDTVIVVLEDDEQFELELPAGAGSATAFMNNGVLTIEVSE